MSGTAGGTTISVDVCVVGAGPVGGTLACRLAAAGVATAIVDRAALPPMEHPDFDGRAYAIAAGSRGVIEAAGLWDRLPFTPGPILDIRVSDGKLGRPASPLFLHFDSRDAGDAPFGWMVEARSLRMALNARLNDLQALSVHAPAEARVERHAEGAIVQIAGGPAIKARLVVAAEGRNSRLRAEAGIPVTHLPYRQTGIVCAIAHALPHHGTAVEHFLPAGPFALLPMAGTEGAPNLSAIVWTERTAQAERIMRLDEAAFTRELGRRLGDHLGAIRLLGRRWSYPLSAMVVHRYTDTRLALVGDAAHGIHPIAGQGLNLGFRDIGCLSGLVIAAVAAGDDPGAPELLRRYQAQRRPDNMMMLAATDALDRLFSSDNPALRLVRDLGIAGVHRIPPLKRLFMRQAMGALTA
ncbi:UbiH/UbiF/VisC/COQ6 family ubiquinone biosynthesis hydroxylase [Limobrevibacterium gyesilva]|uniref:UbiH/UbiF/VisC/COQ6 family ubiquinone biosynthesis hydroxylase n=1 Tax=Limobrevibacterium gyesilva TaxID=2991712 RepID=A0AA41YJ09_9PROT|nr:UbiH/UbiF/VisC/COQ6 family ubiquinone biosynthesis hydroxylase [Limobrevibacterium gyesilva]MCW3474516.1 UbiH/UbiF/VisC/COQ6 family ubiquinone biosynthesis hydroxylase [Limobrevibacterium gyesilva]